MKVRLTNPFKKPENNTHKPRSEYAPIQIDSALTWQRERPLPFSQKERERLLEIARIDLGSLPKKSRLD